MILSTTLENWDQGQTHRKWNPVVESWTKYEYLHKTISLRLSWPFKIMRATTLLNAQRNCSMRAPRLVLRWILCWVHSRTSVTSWLLTNKDTRVVSVSFAEQLGATGYQTCVLTRRFGGSTFPRYDLEPKRIPFVASIQWWQWCHRVWCGGLRCILIAFDSPRGSCILCPFGSLSDLEFDSLDRKVARAIGWWTVKR